MFKCKQCGKTSKPGEPSFRKVIETKTHKHPERPHAQDPGGTGEQIVKEVVVCEGCK